MRLFCLVTAFLLANPTIYEYTYSTSGVFSAQLVRTLSSRACRSVSPRTSPACPNVATGARQVVASDAGRFDFPSSLGFLSGSELAVVSNQQERLTVTNDAIREDAPNLPFVVAKILVSR